MQALCVPTKNQQNGEQQQCATSIMCKEQSFAYPPNTIVERVGSMSEVLQVADTLGSGTYATVKKCHEHNSQEDLAVKVISEETYNNSKKQLQKEVEILSNFPKHPRILSMAHIVRVPGKCFGIVTEFVRGGDLFDFIVQSPNGQLPELVAREVAVQLIEGLTALHDSNIIHRDLKPENILMVNPRGGPIEIKIADFGLATYYDENVPLVKNCGTTAYTAPEVLTKMPYGKPCDIWSLGIIVYAMVHGYLPFHATEKEEMRHKILLGEFRFSRRTPVSNNLKSLIKDMLKMNPKKRPTTHTIKTYSWFKGVHWVDST
eukprot:c7886_g1_i1.p1 GENE.c7886_g1_i1~~c7886_g1_i1.p1  ORF type:complete len:317 (+),score=66.85 c7886_g1_i1:167-1117(+)